MQEHILEAFIPILHGLCSTELCLENLSGSDINWIIISWYIFYSPTLHFHGCEKQSTFPFLGCSSTEAEIN